MRAPSRRVTFRNMLAETVAPGSPLKELGALTELAILIVDDEEPNVRLLERILRGAGYTNVKTTTDPRQVFGLYTDYQPDLMLLDLHMPYMDGFEVMGQLQGEVPTGAYSPILVLTADVTVEAKQRALSMGAKDFLTKPLEMTETLLRVKNLLETRALHVRLGDQNRLLMQRVRERTRELEEAQVEILERMALASDYRHDPTGQHADHVGRLASLLARSLGLAEDQVEMIRRSAPLYDVGKVAISDDILLKPGELTAEEFETVKDHASIGAKILSEGTYPLLRLAQMIALTHHEWWNGTGYPQGMKEDEIPLAGRIVALADAYHALTRDRPYKKAWTAEESVAEISRLSGSQFDPQVVEAFLRVLGTQSHS
jgi:putative two-component system response regulator